MKNNLNYIHSINCDCILLTNQICFVTKYFTTKCFLDIQLVLTIWGVLSKSFLMCLMKLVIYSVILKSQ